MVHLDRLPDETAAYFPSSAGRGAQVARGGTLVHIIYTKCIVHKMIHCSQIRVFGQSAGSIMQSAKCTQSCAMSNILHGANLSKNQLNLE